MDMNDTAAAVTANSLSKFDRHVVLVSSRFKQPSKASPYDNVRKTTEDQVARKQQKDTFEHSAHKSYATIDPVDTPDDQTTRPTVEKSNDKSILTYRKPPDSTNSAIDIVRTNVINESTREHTVCHPNTMNVASKPNGDQLRRSVEERTNDNYIPVHLVPSDRTPLVRLSERFACKDSIDLLDSYSPEKRCSKKELDLERCKLEEEFKKIYSCTQTTLEQLNTIHSKWLLHQYKRVHRFCALGGENCDSHYYKFLKC